MNLEAYVHCCLCPRACGVNRLQGERGYCGASAQVEVGRAALHAWEEPSLSGEHGSGTVFFVHCTLGCIYCQNRQISTRGASGITVDANQLAEIFLQLQDQNAQNINLVTATHYAPHLVEAITEARCKGLTIPVLLNCGGFESVETIRMLDGMVDIYLPDFKYYSSYYAQMYSQTADYFEIADAAIDTMVQQTGAPMFDAQGNMLRGTLIRHLMLPGLAGDTRQILRHIAERWEDRVLVSLMRQYTPIGMEKHQELNRTITEEEYQEAVAYFTDLGLAGYLQEGEAAQESFIPSFRGEGVKRD
ncbi:MAG: radical SAM protein [Butyricicoccus sp.]|nr:radical SAM protein [Butyricicoccus sp.]